MRNPTPMKIATALALSLGTLLAGCAGSDYGDNRSLYSVRQPVIERTNFTLDLATDGSGLPVSEQQRLASWFEAMDLRYGDRVSLDDPTYSVAVREDVSGIASRFSLLIADGSPVTASYVQPGQVRVVITRSVASVPGCPNWDGRTEGSETNATSPGYGCAINGNLAAMVANPEDLIHGQQGTGVTVVSTSTKAIETYRSQTPTGSSGLPAVSSQGGK